MEYAPENEQGVVFLFAHLAPKLGFTSISAIRQAYPDCIARRRHHGQEEEVRIEFELYARNFKIHRHPVRGADCIVCWRNNWPDAPRRLEIIELAEYFGLGRNVWILPVLEPYKDAASRLKAVTWSVPRWARVGDVVLFYLTKPDACIRDVFRVATPVRQGSYGRPPRPDTMAGLRRICKLDDPLYLEYMREDSVLRTANFVRASLQGRRDATVHWSRIRHLMIKQNPRLRRVLEALV